MTCASARAVICATIPSLRFGRESPAGPTSCRQRAARAGSRMARRRSAAPRCAPSTRGVRARDALDQLYRASRHGIDSA